MLWVNFSLVHFLFSFVNNRIAKFPLAKMTDLVTHSFTHSFLFEHKLTKLFSIENFSGAKHNGKVLIITIIIVIIIIIIIITSETGKQYCNY